MNVSIVVPVYNEEENINLLHDEIVRSMDDIDRDSYEVVYVDDGSTDHSPELLAKLAAWDLRVRVVYLRRNFGQTAAMSAGLEVATGEKIVTMDADLQNDPADVPAMLQKLDEGYDLVHGWRRDRQDKFWTRRLPSRIANALISKVTHFPVRDLGCTLKVMRKHVAKELNLYGEMHRFIPILANWRGAKCVEVETNHRPRLYGDTKYGLSRTFRVVLDLITVKYLIRYSHSPMRLFGWLGLGCSVAATLAGAAVVLMKLCSGFDMSGNPMLYICLFGFMISMQFFSLGMLGEMNARTYYESQGRKPYAIREVLTGEQTERARKAA